MAKHDEGQEEVGVPSPAGEGGRIRCGENELVEGKGQRDRRREEDGGYGNENRGKERLSESPREERWREERGERREGVGGRGRERERERPRKAERERYRKRDGLDDGGRWEDREFERGESRYGYGHRGLLDREERSTHREGRRSEESRRGERIEHAFVEGGGREGRDRSRGNDRDRHRKDAQRGVETGRMGEAGDLKDERGRDRNGAHEVYMKEGRLKDERGGSRLKDSDDHGNGHHEEAKPTSGSKRKGRNGEETIEEKKAINGIVQREEAKTNFKAEKPTNALSGKDQSAEQASGRTGGVYIPPFKLAQMMNDIQDKSSAAYQRMTWDALRKSINGLVNKVNASNIKNIIPELFSENLIRGRGLFARSCMKSQMASPPFTHVFSALVAVVNTKFPELGELLLKRIILQFRRALRRNDKPLLLAASKFIAHLVNQQVAHEVVALEVLLVLLETPTDDSVEVAVGFVKECGAMLHDLAPQGIHSIFERFRGILHEGEIDKRVQFMIEGLFAIRKANFQGHPAVLPELDLVEQEDQFTHEISLDEELDAENGLDVFKPDPNYLENENKYEMIKNDILGEESEDDGVGENNSDEGSEEDDDEEDEDEDQNIEINDQTETNLVNLRRTIYLTIMSSVDFEEAGHKLLKIKLEPGQEMELCIMLLECCCQERTYLRYYGLLGQRFCMLNRIYQENFDECFMKQYSMIHRLETNKLRNVAKFFAHLLGTDALPWNVLAYIRLTEEDTTSSSRIFIKILFQELSEHLGLRKLNERLSDPTMQDSFEGIFPKDNPKNTRFAINFFTSIGLGGITDSLREYLKNMPRLIMQQQKPVESESEGVSDSSETSESESSSSGSDSDNSDSSESESESEDSEQDKGRKRRKKG